jgi:adenosylcobinamide-phosphate synthase
MTGFIALAAILFAFGLDHWFGEPAPRWHPVVWMGRYLAWAGARVAPTQPELQPNWRAFCCGALAWSVAVALVALLAVLLEWIVLLPQDEILSALLLGLLLKPMFAWRMLRRETGAVETALGDSLSLGRRTLERLVSRETSQLTESQVRESAIESLAENLNDSVVAPVFWFAVAGLPGAAVYRFANTADAMWGYRGARNGAQWEWAGKWAARADDLLSWIPARLTGLFICLGLARLPLLALRREAARTPSPNSGWPMAAMALVLRTRLSKPGVFCLNEGAEAPGPAHVSRALAIAGRAVLLLLALACLSLLAFPAGVRG